MHVFLVIIINNNNVNMEWRASLIYICIFIKGGAGGQGFFAFYIRGVKKFPFGL